jgi:hypothetical protein
MEGTFSNVPVLQLESEGVVLASYPYVGFPKYVNEFSGYVISG